MEFRTVVFYALALVVLYAGLRVVTARSPVVAVLHLMLAFFATSGIWVLLQAEFLAIALVLVYVGAVMVLFLFVVMLLDINIDRLREGFWRYLPLGATLGLLVVLELGVLLGARYLGVLEVDAPQISATASNTQALGRLIYTDYVYPFEIASVILLVAIIAAIVLTYRGPKKTKYTPPARQVRVRAQDRVRLLKMPAETRD